MFEFPYLIEILTPRRSPAAEVESRLQAFGERYRRILESGSGVSIPDNPMGRPRLGALEALAACGLPVNPARTVMNLNTFHSKTELDGLLDAAVEAGLRYLLVVRGDGGPDLSRLAPASIGGRQSVATSMDLLRYIHRAYAGRFVTGVAFNQYNPMPFETDRLQQKIAAGAQFVVTQPVIGRDPAVDAIAALRRSRRRGGVDVDQRGPALSECAQTRGCTGGRLRSGGKPGGAARGVSGKLRLPVHAQLQTGLGWNSAPAVKKDAVAVPAEGFSRFLTPDGLFAILIHARPLNR